MENFAVIDFETMGMAPNENTRTVAISLAIIRNGQVKDRFHSLMNSGLNMPEEAEMVTGITSKMLADAPPSSEVIRQAVALAKDCRLVSHNARFDKAFWLFELAANGIRYENEPFICTLKLAQQVFPDLDSYRLKNLTTSLNLNSLGHDQNDADMTANLLLRILRDFPMSIQAGRSLV